MTFLQYFLVLTLLGKEAKKTSGRNQLNLHIKQWRTEVTFSHLKFFNRLPGLYVTSVATENTSINIRVQEFIQQLKYNPNVFISNHIYKQQSSHPFPISTFKYNIEKAHKQHTPESPTETE